MAPVRLAVSPRRHQIALSFPASALGGTNPVDVSYAVAMMINAEQGEGLSEIRPAVDCAIPGTPDWVKEWRICGGRGEVSSTAPYDTDTSEPNIMKIFVPAGQNQHEILRGDGRRSVLPYVRLDTAPTLIDASFSITSEKVKKSQILTIRASNNGETPIAVTARTILGTVKLGTLAPGATKIQTVDTRLPVLPAFSVKLTATAPDGTSKTYTVRYAGSK